MKAGFFITATDTGIGKTFVCAALARALVKRGYKVGVMKPIETGCMERNGILAPSDATLLKKASGSEDSLDLINPYRFKLAVAPNIASKAEGIKIDLKKIKSNFDRILGANDITIVEGCGGITTPISKDKTIKDLILLLGLPIIIVTQSKLGCINHTTLTYEYAKNAGIKIRGVILNHPDMGKDSSQRFNMDELKRLGMPAIAELPFVKEGKGVEDFIDPEIF